MTPKPLIAPIYMDHNATTPLDPRVVEAMLPYLGEYFGNASSSSHAYGWQSANAVTKARAEVASLVGCLPREVLWTSGATESNNLAIFGVVRFFNGQKPHIITQATEHKAVLEVCEAAREFGAEVTVLGVDSDGLVNIKEIERAIQPNTVMISIMMANNEVGALQPVQEIGELCRARKIIFHTDAAQSAGKYEFSLKDLPADLVSISAHKLYGPKGVGALIVRHVNRDFELKPILFGGEQERKLRPGTLNVPGIVGLGRACALAVTEMKEESARLARFQEDLLARIREDFPQVRLNGPARGRLCNNISLSFPDISADQMALALSGVAFSSGSACNSANPLPSHVLKAMGIADTLARSTLRLGAGRFTTAKEMAAVTEKIMKMLEKAYAARAPKLT